MHCENEQSPDRKPPRYGRWTLRGTLRDTVSSDKLDRSIITFPKLGMGKVTLRRMLDEAQRAESVVAIVLFCQFVDFQRHWDSSNFRENPQSV